MGKLTSIYNFVPLNEQVFHPSWANEVSQDAPFSDGEDGIIDVTLRNVSPLFIRNGSADRDNPDPHSANVKVGDKRLYFIPGSSLKGMIRSTLEIMSFGKMTQYTDRFFALRDVGNNTTTDGKAYLDQMDNAKPAWLRWDSDKEKLYLAPCEGKLNYIDDEKLLKLFPSFGDVYPAKGKIKTGWQKSKVIREDAGELYPPYEKDGKRYRIVCTGNMNGKTRDFLFPESSFDEFEVEEGLDYKDKRVTKAFFSVHEPTPDFKTCKSDKNNKNKRLSQTVIDFLDTGGSLPVFYMPGDKEHDVKAIGLSKLIRMPYGKSISEIINAQQTKKDKNFKDPDLVETMFGYISGHDNESLRGRVQFGNAFSDNPISDDELGHGVNGVLGQPKASFYPFYLKQTHNPYKTYNNPDDGISGRKLYRIHRGDTTIELPKGNNNRNVSKNAFYPIPSNQTFRLKIVFHNLRKMEIGALLSALKLHNTKNVWHNIGLARGYGYGKLAIDKVKLSDNLSFTEDEYLKEFEYQMSIFTDKNLHKLWIETPQIIKLMQIHSEHSDSDLHVMDLDEYKEKRKNENFGTLEESSPVITASLLSSADKVNVHKMPWVKSHKAEYDEVNSLLTEGKYDEAINKLKAIIKELSIPGLDTNYEETLIEKAQNSKNTEFEKLQQELKAQQEQQKQQKLSAGLGATLDEVYPAGTPKADQYKVSDYNGFNKRTDQWMKKLKETVLTDSEKEAYAATFRRLFPQGYHPKKEDKNLADKGSKLWQTAKLRLGDKFDELLGDLYRK